jgi:CBS domain-containing protein
MSPARRGSIIGAERKEPPMTASYAQHTHPAASLESVRIADAMHRGLVTCRPDTRLDTVARIMAAHRIHAVVVTQRAGGAGWGLVSDLDLVAAAAEGAAGSLTVGEIASEPRLSVRPDDTVAWAARLMRDHATHHVVVLGRHDDRPVGIVSTLDVADVISELPQQVA